MGKSNFNVILKISEICPLACDYCYYFRNDVFQHKVRPSYIKKGIVKSLCYEIMQYHKNKPIGKVFFSLHGGEPLAIGKKRFCQICDTIKNHLKVPYEFGLQSNGILIDNEWIEILKKYNIRLGFSIDGPKEYHDISRKFKNGLGSFDLVDKNIRLCLKKEMNIGILMVANPNFDPQIIFDYLIDDLCINGMDILIRDYTHDTIPSPGYVDKVSYYMSKWMDIWFARNDKTIRIRIFDSIINLLIGKDSELEFGFKKSTHDIPTITVYTNGDVSPADELTSISDNFMNIGKNILTNSLEDIFSLPVFDEINKAYITTPIGCRGCCWEHVCGGGGGILERYHSKNGFSNSGVYCKVWSRLFTIVSSRLLEQGYEKEKLLNILSGTDCMHA